MRELKFNYGPMKAHDCHVIMTQLLPVALRGILPPKIHAPIIKLCSFFNAISKKVIDVSTLEQLQRDIAKTLVRLEMYFLPTYFDISVHLLVHLVDQIRALGPMYQHQMFPFERLMKVFRRYVRNRVGQKGASLKDGQRRRPLSSAHIIWTSKGSEFHNLVTREDYVTKERSGRNLLQ